MGKPDTVAELLYAFLLLGSGVWIGVYIAKFIL